MTMLAISVQHSGRFKRFFAVNGTAVKLRFLIVVVALVSVANLAWSAAQDRPTLEVTRSGTNVLLTWHTNGFVIQTTDALTPTALWTNANLALVTNGNDYTATVTPVSNQKFFRLAMSPPRPPDGLVLSAEEDAFYLNWNIVPTACWYNLYLAAAPGVNRTNYLSLPQGQTIAGIVPPYFVKGLTNGTRYYAVVTAVNGAGESAESMTATNVFGPNASVSGSFYINVASGGSNTNTLFLPGVFAWLVNLTNGAATSAVQTDSDGQYRIPEQPAGVYRLCYQWTNTFAACGGCSTQFVTISNQPVNLLPEAIGSFCPVNAGQLTLGDDRLFQETDPFLGLDIQATAKIIGPGITNNAFLNNAGQFVFLGSLFGQFQLIADCEAAHAEKTVSLPSSNFLSITLSNAAPVINAAHALDPITGRQTRRAQPGGTVQLVIEATDPDGDALNYHWFPGSDTDNFVSYNSPTVLWPLPNGYGLHTMYFTVRDNKGGVAVGKLVVSTDPYLLFTGVVTDNGSPLATNPTVSINGQSALCDTNGYFALRMPTNNSRYVVAINEPGYETYGKIFSDELSQARYSLFRVYEQIIDSTASSTITDPVGGGVLSIAPNAFATGSGASYSGSVIIGISTVDPLNPAARLPGLPLSVSAGTNYSLLCYGGVFVAARDPAGNSLIIRTSATAQVTMPLGQFRPVARVPIPIWVWDPSTGYYVLLAGYATFTDNNHVTYLLRSTGMTVCADAIAQAANAAPTECITLEIDRSINLPVDVTIFRPSTEVRTITERFTIINNLPTNQPITFKIFEVNGVALTNACIVSNTVTTGPGNPGAAQGSNCLPVKLFMPGVPEPTKILAFKVGPGDPTYAAKYYDAIDPDHTKTTFADWKKANHFDEGGVVEAIYFNNGDLGFGRWMGMKIATNGDVAYYVSNYETPDKAIDARATNQLFGLGATVCMEYSANPRDTNGPPNPYTKFYVYNASNFRSSGVELDKRGEKFVPHLCIVCHGGDRKAVANINNIGKGDFKAKFLPFDLESFHYSAQAAFTQTNQAASFKQLNAAVLDTGPTPSIKELLQGWYGGPGLLGDFNKDFVPPGYSGNPSQIELYSKVFKESCRSCHSARNNNQPSLASFDDLTGYSVGELVCDTGAMPNALRTFNIFWASRCSSNNQPCILKTALGLTQTNCATCP